MDVLITNAELGALGGTETYLYSLASEFKRRKSEWHLDFYSPNLGVLAKKISLLGYSCHNHIEQLKEKYDLIHVQHWKNLLPIRKRYPHTPLFYLCHGVGEQEIPPVRLAKDINLLAVVSQEVKEKIQGLSAFHRMVPIIANAVDTERFKPRRPLREQGAGLHLLILSNYPSQQTIDIIEFLRPVLAMVSLVGRNADSLLRAIKGKGLKTAYYGYDIWSLEEVINENDVVVSLGRGILEALACGRPAIVFGIHGGDGLVGRKNIEKIRRNNFSGRYYRWSADSSDLRKSLEPLLKDDLQVLGKEARELVLARFTLAKMARKIEGIYNFMVKGRP